MDARSRWETFHFNSDVEMGCSSAFSGGGAPFRTVFATKRVAVPRALCLIYFLIFLQGFNGISLN